MAIGDRRCDECGQPVPYLEQWQQVVEGGSAIAKGHRACIESEWPDDGWGRYSAGGTDHIGPSSDTPENSPQGQ